MKFTIQKEIELNFFRRIKKDGDKCYVWYVDKETGLTMKEKISINTYRIIRKELNGKETV